MRDETRDGQIIGPRGHKAWIGCEVSPAHVLEPTYRQLREAVIGGAWPPGFRLETARLATDFGVSVTPVRDSLNQLTGERLVAFSPGEGYRIPHLDGSDYMQLISWHEMLILLALRARRWEPRDLQPFASGPIQGRFEQIFAAIGQLAGNTELDWSLDNAAARLRRYCLTETAVFDDLDEEADRLEAVIGASNHGNLAVLVRRYHQRRRHFATEILRRARAKRS